MTCRLLAVFLQNGGRVVRKVEVAVVRYYGSTHNKHWVDTETYGCNGGDDNASQIKNSSKDGDRWLFVHQGEGNVETWQYSVAG
jgi:hypothetical protein